MSKLSNRTAALGIMSALALGTLAVGTRIRERRWHRGHQPGTCTARLDVEVAS